MKLKPRANLLELSVSLQKPDDQVNGDTFENLIVKYFDGGFKQTNGKRMTPFYDVKQGKTYYSVKYSKAVKSGTLGSVAGDNIKTTIAQLISQTVLASGGKYSEIAMGGVASNAIIHDTLYHALHDDITN